LLALAKSLFPFRYDELELKTMKMNLTTSVKARTATPGTCE